MIILCVSFLILLLIGVPVAFAIGLSAVATIFYEGLPLAVVFQRMSSGMNIFSFLAIPFFIFAGELMLYHARLSLTELNRACNEIDELHGLHRGTVSVAIVESVARGLMPSALEAFWKRYPGITADIRVMGSQQAANAVSEGDCDLAVVFDVRIPRSARQMANVALPLGVLALPRSRFAARDELKLFDLANERVILSDASLTLGASVEQALGRALVDLQPRARTNSIGLMVDLARRDLGTVLQTRVGIEQELAEGTLAFVPIRDVRLPPRKLMLLSRSEKEMPDAASALGRLLMDMIERLRSDTGG